MNPTLDERLRVLEVEKFHLPYAWLKANGLESWDRLDFARAEKATAARRREILDEQKVLRAERSAAKAAARAAREKRAAARKATRQAEREAATAECQICEGRQCMDRYGRMVHHGYQRPGYGYIVGDCTGVARLPYPATDALVEYLRSLEGQRAGAQLALDTLDERTAVSKLGGHGRPAETIRKAEVAPAVWAREIANLRARLDGEVRWCSSELVRVRARIAAAPGVQAVANSPACTP